jgi:hypothetical protein
MNRALRFGLCVILALGSLSTVAQNGPLAGTVVDVDEGRGRLQIDSDTEAHARITIETDSVATVYYGFGSVIADKPEIFTGSSGFSNIRLGDRVEVRGSVRSEGVVKADRVTLLGRAVAAPQVGVGSTRDPATTVHTPTDDRATGSTTTAAPAVEGTIRQINLQEGRIVIQTTQRSMMTVRTARTTPVVYRGETFRTTNLEIGDVIRVDTDSRPGLVADEVTARRIEVTRSVQEAGSAAGNAALVTTVQGRVTRVEVDAEAIYIAANRGEILVDMTQATNSNGDVMGANDIRVGDQLEISGSYDRAGQTFLAATTRFVVGQPGTSSPGVEPVQYALVTISGTVTETLEDASRLSVRERDTNRLYPLWVANDLAVRTKGTTYTTANQLRLNDTVVVEAFRDPAGNLVVQTIRLRNR